MMNNTIKILVFLVGILFLNKLSAQEQEKLSYRLLARPLKDSVLLRWAPMDYQSWLVGNNYGYRVWRATVLRNGEYVENEPGAFVCQVPLKPAPLADWESLVEEDDYAGVAAQALYGEGFMVETNLNKSMMDIFHQEQEQTARFSFALLAADQSVPTAKLSGLWWTDTTAKANESYLYKIWPAGCPVNASVDTAFVFTGIAEYQPLPKPIDLKALPGDKVVNLQWDNQYQVRYYNSFFVERSADGGEHFQRLNKHPLINTTPDGQDELEYAYYMDSIPNNHDTFIYRVVGISPFGELSPPSEPVEVVGVSQIRYAPNIVSEEVVDNNRVILQWEFNKQESHKVDGYIVLRADELKGQYEVLKDSLSPMYQQYVDEHPIPTAYYRVQTYNKSGFGPASQGALVQLKDTIPPVPPVGLVAEVDTTGRLSLKWTANTERDIYGYRVYRANGKDEEFSQLTREPIKETQWMDHITLKTLSKHVYYKVMAVDSRQNYSRFSRVLEVDRPDIVPPSPPAIREATPREGGVFLSWVPSSSSDVVEMGIYRNRVSSQEWEPVFSTSAIKTGSWSDLKVLPATEYRYLMMAVDSAGNESLPTKPVHVKTVQGELPAVSKIEGRCHKKNGAVVLSWELPKNLDIEKVLIYRKSGNEAFQLIIGVNSDQLNYRDYSVRSNIEYHYRVRLKYMGKRVSGFSKEVVVKCGK